MCVCVYTYIQAEKTDGEVTGDFVLSLALTAQTKTKSHKLHDLDHIILAASGAVLTQKHLDPVKAVRERRV